MSEKQDKTEQFEYNCLFCRYSKYYPFSAYIIAKHDNEEEIICQK